MYVCMYVCMYEKGGECEIVLILRAKRENEVEAQRSEKLPIKQKSPSLFT